MTNRVLDDFARDSGVRALGGEEPSVEFSSGCLDAGPGAALPSTLPVMELASGSAAAAGYAASALSARRSACPPPDVRVDPASVAASFRGERLMRLDGAAWQPFAELSGFFRAGDGWIRTHANYSHHRERLLAALDLPPDADKPALAARVGSRNAIQIEDDVRAAGGVAAAVRSQTEWRAHPQYASLAGVPMTAATQVGEAPRRLLGPAPVGPASGLRVLDLTRVLAGPVAGRTLAWLGAEVLRVDSPRLPEIGWQHLATGAGKRSTLLDLDDAEDRCQFDHLLGEADVVLLGYRASALERLGLRPDELADRNPGLVVARLSAWGDDGPWAGARGFDSIVQAATGIALRESARESDRHPPGALPAQALDYASGYLLAAGVLAAVTRQLSGGGSWSVECRLARTAQWLLESGPSRRIDRGPDWDLSARLEASDTPSGRLELAGPAACVDGVPDHFSGCGRAWGADPARWTSDE